MRIPTGPQYSYLELKLEFANYGELDEKIDDLNNGLIAKLAAAVTTAAELAKLGPDAIAAMQAWDGSKTQVEAPVYQDQDAANEAAAVRSVKEMLGGSEVPDEPWSQPIQPETRPAPPWAAAPTPVKSAPVDFEDF